MNLTHFLDSHHLSTSIDSNFSSINTAPFVTNQACAYTGINNGIIALSTVVFTALAGYFSLSNKNLASYTSQNSRISQITGRHFLLNILNHKLLCGVFFTQGTTGAIDGWSTGRKWRVSNVVYPAITGAASAIIGTMGGLALFQIGHTLSGYRLQKFFPLQTLSCLLFPVGVVTTGGYGLRALVHAVWGK